VSRGWDTAVSVGAWNDLVKQYRELGGEGGDDFELAELLRNKIAEVEGE
jgi:hypothetical protein